MLLNKAKQHQKAFSQIVVFLRFGEQPAIKDRQIRLYPLHERIDIRKMQVKAAAMDAAYPAKLADADFGDILLRKQVYKRINQATLCVLESFVVGLVH